jgi:hypothetical protein
MKTRFRHSQRLVTPERAAKLFALIIRRLKRIPDLRPTEDRVGSASGSKEPISTCHQ